MVRRKPKVTLADILGDDAFVELPSDDNKNTPRDPVPVESRKGRPGLSGALGLTIRMALGLGALAVFAFPTFLVILVGMMPAFVAVLVSRHRDRRKLQAFAIFNLTGVMPFLVALWQDGHNVGQALHILSDIYSWAVMYSAAAVGLSALWLGPHIAAAILNVMSLGRRRNLDAIRVSLIDEWGTDILPEGGMIPPKAAMKPEAKAERPDAA